MLAARGDRVLYQGMSAFVRLRLGRKPWACVKVSQSSSVRLSSRQGYSGVEGPQSRYGVGSARWLFNLV
jgi:hypothetical protein